MVKSRVLRDRIRVQDCSFLQYPFLTEKMVKKKYYRNECFGLAWDHVKVIYLQLLQKRKSDPDLTFIKNISKEHHYEDEVITNFQNILNYKTEKC